MLRLITLFSISLLLIAFSQIKKEFDLQVEIVAQEVEEKPKLSPPQNLPLKEDEPIDLSPRLLEPPKEMEFRPVARVEGDGLSCGKPKDAIAYKVGVDQYLKGDFLRAEKELSSILTMSSPYRPMAEYVLGLIKLKEGQRSEALKFFENSCRIPHRYRDSACELYYALNFELKGSVPKNENPLWSVIYEIKEKKTYREPNCQEVVFKNYCNYVLDFVKGKAGEEYKDSTTLRRAVVLFQTGKLDEAEKLLLEYSKPTKPYRDVALYYLGLLALQKKDTNRAYQYASLLETINREYANSLYSQIAQRDVFLARITYSVTKDLSFLELAGIIAYNRGDYKLALSNFLEAKNIKYAVYSAIRMGDYKTAYTLLEGKREKDREDYLWLLESAYWANLPMEEPLKAVRERYPELYKEYLGWNFFRKGDWLSALSYFQDPYYRALSYYNLKKYEDVLMVLRGIDHPKARLLKAKSALFLGKPALARSFLTESSPDELYLLGLSYFMEGKYERSIDYFKKVPKESPFGARALMKTGDALYNLGRVDSAKEVYWDVLKRFPEDPLASQATLALLGMEERELPLSDREKLIKIYLQKEPNSPYVPELKYQLADLLIKRGEKREAEKILIELFEGNSPLKYKALLKLATIEEDKINKAVLLYNVYKEGNSEESAIARRELVKLYEELGDLQSMAELLEVGDLSDKERAVQIYANIQRWDKAIAIANQLTSLGYRSPSFDSTLWKIYENTKDRNILSALTKSQDINLSAKAKLEMAKLLKAEGKQKEALEYLVDISLNHKGAQVYNSAILEGVQIFLELRLRRDASCFLERVDANSLSQEERVKIEMLKKELPKCEVR
ncbi:MAG: tetratricopeptide repeat protein [Thermocrinis sp.]|jgi:TolA-binding protein|uniref:tetratricopeptide repeat protein n=1 Tax=Thermocrinis sp. TaxID=2024383 RepID=UPI003C07A1C5